MKNFLFLVILVVSIGITPNVFASLDNQICIDKVWMENIKGKIACVTPTTAEKLVERGWGTILSDDIMEDSVEIPGLERYETSIGVLETTSNYPTPETTQKLKDTLLFQRAVQVYLLSLPAVAGAGIYDEFDDAGAQSGEIIYWSGFIESDTVVATPNRSVIYSLSFLDLSEGPMIIDAPKNLNGGVNNLYQQPLTDIGFTGPDKGEGGKYLILPPGYEGEIPEEYIVVYSDTMQTFYLARGSAPNGNVSIGIEQVKGASIYKLSEANNPPEEKFVDVLGTGIDMMHPTTYGFWEFLHQTYSKETIVRPQDKFLIGLMQTIGIDPREEFSIDENSKKIFEEAAIVGNLMMKNNAFNSPNKADYIAYPGFSNWEFIFQTNTPMFEDEYGIPMFNQKNTYVHQAAFTSEGMVLKSVGKGSQYLASYRDANDDWLSGSNLYSLHVPANVPIVNFWSAIVYDTETRALIQNNLQPIPGISSVDVEKLIQNSDGSYDLYFGPEAPDGYENNWIKTNEGEGFFVFFRFYGPTEAFFDKSWQLPNIEKIE